MEEKKELQDFKVWAKQHLSKYRGSTYKEIKDQLTGEHEPALIEDNKELIKKWLQQTKANSKRKESQKRVTFNVATAQTITVPVEIPAPLVLNQQVEENALEFELNEQKKALRSLRATVVPMVESFNQMKIDYDQRTATFKNIQKEVKDCLFEQDALVNKAIEASSDANEKLTMFIQNTNPVLSKLQTDYIGTCDYASQTREWHAELDVKVYGLTKKVNELHEAMLLFDKKYDGLTTLLTKVSASIRDLLPRIDILESEIRKGDNKRRKITAKRTILVEGIEIELTESDIAEAEAAAAAGAKKE